NLVGVFLELGDTKKGRQFMEESLAMRERVYKSDHPEVATGLNNMGCVLMGLGDHAKALHYCKKALDMELRLRGKQDHPSVALGLNNVGGALLLQGEAGKARPYFEKGLAMRRRLVEDYALSASESEAFNYALILEQSVCRIVSCADMLDSPEGDAA